MIRMATRLPVSLRTVFRAPFGSFKVGELQNMSSRSTAGEAHLEHRLPGTSPGLHVAKALPCRRK